MQSEYPGVLVHAEVQHAEKRVNQTTSEVTDIKEGGKLYLMLIENGEPIIKRVSCSLAAAKAREVQAKEFRRKNPAFAFELDQSEYEINGRKGTSLRLVEEGAARRQRASFSFEDETDEVFEETKQVPPPRPAPNGNGSTPALAGAR